eukprot:952462-Heterocapsa_arctica.AAC.1
MFTPPKIRTPAHTQGKYDFPSPRNFYGKLTQRRFMFVLLTRGCSPERELTAGKSVSRETDGLPT